MSTDYDIAAHDQLQLLVEIDVDAERAPSLAADLEAALRSALDYPEYAAVTAQPMPRTSPERPIPALRILTRPRIVQLHGEPVELTRLEYDLLLFLCRHPHQVHDRPALMTEVWGLPEHPHSRTVDVHVRRLRRKLGPELPLITTVRGVGYRIDTTGLFVIDDGPVTAESARPNPYQLTVSRS